MTLNRFAKRRDANEPQLIKLARALGAQFERAPPLDGWCGWKGRWFPVEIKRPDGPRGGRFDRHYTPEQERFIERCQQHGNPLSTWRGEEDVRASLGVSMPLR